MKLILWFALGVALVLSCSKSEESTSENGADSSVSAGVAGLAGAVHTLNTQTGTLSTVLTDLPENDRAVSTCGSAAANDTCSGNIKNATYGTCTALPSNQSYSGAVTLLFSAAGCTLNALTDTVTRTLSMTRTLQYEDEVRFNGTSLATTSESHTDYRGATIAGGVRLTRTSPSPSPVADLEVLGVHKILTSSKGKVLYDISLRTTSALQVTGDLAGDRTVSGGSLEVIHNKAEYVATFSTSELVFNSTTCCYPVSGTIAVTFTGKVVGDGTISFPGTCGKATLTRDGVATDVVLHGCE